MVGRLLCFWEGIFSGAMLNFRGVCCLNISQRSEPRKPIATGISELASRISQGDRKSEVFSIPPLGPKPREPTEISATNIGKYLAMIWVHMNFLISV